MGNTAQVRRAGPKSNRFTWSWRHAVPAAAIVLAVAACTDSKDKAPTGPRPNAPTFDVNDPSNGTGSCFSADVYKAGFLQQLKDSLGQNSLESGGCTANDVRVAQAIINSYSVNGGPPIQFVKGDTVGCNSGDVLSINMNARVAETATSQRTDIGIWIANDGGNARVGNCKQFNLVSAGIGLGQTVGGVTNEDGDQCGDMNAGDTTNVALGSIDAICRGSAPLLHIGSCLGWTQPGTGGDDRTCPTDNSNTADGIPAPVGADRFRYGTTPGTTSKCNCEGFDVPIRINQVATIEVIKSCNPSSDPGTFDFQIDHSVGTFGAGRTCTAATPPGNTTGAQTVSAGTSLNPGADHTVLETNFTTANYTSTVSCTKNGSPFIASQSYTSPNDVNVHVNPNDAVVCTFVNTRKPRLTIVKKVINDNNGTATVADFGITASPGTLNFDAGVNDPDAAHKTYTSQTFVLDTVGKYTFKETPLTGYVAGTWSCTAGTLNSSAANNGAVTLAAGANAVCTITNDDQGSTLKVVKVIKNDNGGVKTVGDFSLTIDGSAAVFPAGSCVTVTTTTTCTSSSVNVNAGTHTFTEAINVAGYTPGTWSCTPVAAETVAADGGSVVVPLGQNITCTIQNDDQPGSLTIIKHIVNDNGGTKIVGDFGLTSNAGTLTPFTSASEGTNQTKYTSQKVTVNRGNYTFSENDVAGYTEGTWSCTPTAATGTAFNNGSVFVDNGKDVTCEITNNDQPATLTIVKVVKGVGASFSFGTSTSSATPLDNSFTLTPPTDGSDQKVFSNLNPGTYNVTETPTAGYVPTDASCTGDFVFSYPAGTLTVSPVLANGQSATCTFVNEKTTSNTTRTQGFWATHSGLTQVVWFGGTFGPNTFPGIPSSQWQFCSPAVHPTIDNLGKLLGGFWSGISQTSTSKKRSSLDQARMQLLQQLLAAMLNVAAFQATPPITIASAQAAYCGTDITAIKNAQAAMASFNTSGDNGTFTPGGSANGKLAKSLANLAYWDVLP